MKKNQYFQLTVKIAHKGDYNTDIYIIKAKTFSEAKRIYRKDIKPVYLVPIKKLDWFIGNDLGKDRIFYVSTSQLN